MLNRQRDLRRELGHALYGRVLRRRPRIGIYGGQFDPPHYGHLLAAQRTRFAKKLDKVLFVPCGENPVSKPHSSTAEDRYDLVVAATAANKHFDTSRVDIRQKGVSYMINTVEAVIDEYGDDCDLFAMISSEYLNPDFKHFLKNWVGAAELFAIKQLTFLVFPRDHTEVEKIHEWAKLIPQAKIEVLDVPSLPLSSTLIRGWIGQGRSAWYTMPWNVQNVVAKKRLYLPPGLEPYKPTPCPISDVKHVGLYPGRFDPIHYADLRRGEWAREEKGMDRIVYVTSANPPGAKWLRDTAEDRHDMVVAGTAENPYFDAWRSDIESGKTSYALQTVEEARRRFGKDVEFSLLVRGEFLDPKHPNYLRRWMGADELFKQTKFIAFPSDWTEVEQAQQWAKRIPNASIDVVYAPVQPIESDDVQKLVADGNPTLYCTPSDVQQLIEKKGMYGAGEAFAKRR